MHIFIAVPSDGLVHAWFAQSLAGMVGRTLAQGFDGKPLGITTKVEIGKLPMVRNRLLKQGIEAKADYMLWLDSDHVFPDWTLLRLLLADQDVVGINQPSRSRPHVPTARKGAGRLYGQEADAKKGLIERVSHIGFPIVLMKMSIVPKLEAQAAKEGRALFPLFDFTLTDDPEVSGGEDAFFCQRLTEAGIEIHVDHQLSWATWHMADLPVGMQETLNDRPAAEKLG